MFPCLVECRLCWQLNPAAGLGSKSTMLYLPRTLLYALQKQQCIIQCVLPFHLFETSPLFFVGLSQLCALIMLCYCEQFLFSFISSTLPTVSPAVPADSGIFCLGLSVLFFRLASLNSSFPNSSSLLLFCMNISIGIHSGISCTS